MSLRAKLLLLFLLVAVGPMATVGLVSYYNSVRSVEEVVKQRALSGQPLIQVLPGLARAYPRLATSDQGTVPYAERDEEWLLAGANLKEPAWTLAS